MVSTTRESILQSANRVIIERGVKRLTLEAVAKEAGVSKGGLLYHFPSKEALVQGMLARLITKFNAKIQTEMLQDQGPPQGQWLRAFINATFSSGQVDVSAGLLAALALNPDLLDPNRKTYQALQAKFEADGLDPVQATMIRLAVDGLFFSEVLGFAPPEGPMRSALQELLLAMTKDIQG